LEVADVNPRSFEKKSNSNVPSSGTLGDETNDDNLVIDGSESKKRSSREVVTPLAHFSYADQLEQKKYSLMQILKKLVSHDCFYFLIHIYIYTFLRLNY
jgi:tRNA (uracil-5-)-methyltransferase